MKWKTLAGLLRSVVSELWLGETAEVKCTFRSPRSMREHREVKVCSRSYFRRYTAANKNVLVCWAVGPCFCWRVEKCVRLQTSKKEGCFWETDVHGRNLARVCRTCRSGRVVGVQDPTLYKPLWEWQTGISHTWSEPVCGWYHPQLYII